MSSAVVCICVSDEVINSVKCSFVFFLLTIHTNILHTINYILTSKWTSRKNQSTLGSVVILWRVASYVGWAKLTSFFLIYTHRNVFVLRIYFAILVQYYFTDIRLHLEGECCAPLHNSQTPLLGKTMGIQKGAAGAAAVAPRRPKSESVTNSRTDRPTDGHTLL